jgi:hypothetical protein
MKGKITVLKYDCLRLNRKNAPKTKTPTEASDRGLLPHTKTEFMISWFYYTWSSN